jgi:histidinol dehydrogenase
MTAAQFLRGATGNPSGEAGVRVRQDVQGIIERVRTGGDAALRQFTEKFDGVRLKDLQIPAEALEEAWRQAAPPLRRALKQAGRNIARYQRSIRPGPTRRIETAPGVTITTSWRPLPSVACYAPGGRAAYPSTVLMMAVTARTAGVGKVILLSPPQRDGKPSPAVLAASHLAKVDAVFAVGGAQAIAAVAFGTETVPRVPKVVGPGNAYVTEAKRQLFGTVGIDGLAGPTELAILADATVPADWVAMDLAAQAEHDPDARTVLVTASSRVARRVQERVERVVAASPRREILRQSLLRQGLVVMAPTQDDAVSVLNELAPEHVELLCRNPRPIADRLQTAGTVFVGPLSPAPLGDYVTGANHVLPTGRSARWASPLSVFDFMRQHVVQQVDRRGISGVGPAAIELATREGLPMHAESVRRRLA